MNLVDALRKRNLIIVRTGLNDIRLLKIGDDNFRLSVGSSTPPRHYYTEDFEDRNYMGWRVVTENQLSNSLYPVVDFDSVRMKNPLGFDCAWVSEFFRYFGKLTSSDGYLVSTVRDCPPDLEWTTTTVERFICFNWHFLKSQTALELIPCIRRFGAIDIEVATAGDTQPFTSGMNPLPISREESRAWVSTGCLMAPYPSVPDPII
jgi:hypothetical protein